MKSHLAGFTRSLCGLPAGQFPAAWPGPEDVLCRTCERIRGAHGYSSFRITEFPIGMGVTMQIGPWTVSDQGISPTPMSYSGMPRSQDLGAADG